MISHTYGQVANFTSVNPNNPEATRWHIEPAINLPLVNSWGSLNTEAKLMATHFQQTIPNGFAADYASRNPGSPVPDLEDSVNRVLPQFKTDGKVVFDRPMDWSEGYTQTIEPRMQYLYVPYRDQSDIYTYDSTLLQTDYSGLFRDRSYSGLDRIASQNRVAAGVTSRIYDDALVERFNVSVGQIYYLSRSRTGIKVATLIIAMIPAASSGLVTPIGRLTIAGACAVVCNMTPVLTASR
ncbi:Organic solvent tolerance protein [Serratia fonticola]|uniref:Organic solvent tolerance protein n=1 Tax=Serratia fonticola TaxID=47917 RepID=A0A4U9UB36_SERFO|nr:Organic solvent tolerance protein [Serratia fonticola]